MNESYLTVAGNLIAEPERHIAVTGATFATFRIASTERRAGRDGSGYEDIHTSYFKVIVWRKLAENVLTSLKKGQPVIVSGRVRVKVYTRKDETSGTSVEIEGLSVGHNLQHGTTAFVKGQKQPVIEGDRCSDPAVNAVRENDWGAPDVEPGEEFEPPQFGAFGDTGGELDDPYGGVGAPGAPTPVGSGVGLV